jgi:valine--pyruvate aminotransferase
LLSMALSLSRFGQKLCTHSGILELMDDLGNALSSGSGKIIMLGGGNPAAIPSMQAIWRQRTLEMLQKSPGQFDSMLGNYDPPQGRPEFIAAVVKLFQERFGWKIGPENVAITNGSQTSFFCLFNMLAGEFADGTNKKILLPVVPEYIGYADQGVSKNLFVAQEPAIERRDAHSFKYRVNFDSLEVGPEVAAIAVSRPANPTGNVLTNSEIAHLSALAKERGIPLIIDNAYGHPFPGIIFSEIVPPLWEDHLILTFSLSKIGLPGVRTGIVIANSEIIRCLYAANAIVSLANGNIGQALVAPLLASGELVTICQTCINPFYAEKAHHALACVKKSFDPAWPYFLHKCEGSPFLWLWLEGLACGTYELYQRLKARNVLVVPGKYFFYGLSEPWDHANQCLRINYSQPESTVSAGIKIIAEELAKVWT